MPSKDSQLRILLRTFSNCSEPGTLAFVFHRLTGLILAGYLFLHLFTISTSAVSPGAFDAKLGSFNQPLFLTLDVALIAAASFHAFNGLRIIFFDLGLGMERQKLSSAIALILTAVIAILAAELIFPLILRKG